MKNKITSKSLLTESEKFRFQELAGIKPRSSKLMREAFPDDQDEVEEEPVTDPMDAEPHSSPEMEGGDGMDLDNGGDPSGDLGLDTDDDLGVDSSEGSADVGVAEDPMVDKIVELVSRGIRTALLDAKSSGELDISSSEPEEVEGADLEPSTEPGMDSDESELDSDLGPETDETENNLGTPDEETLDESWTDSFQKEKHPFDNRPTKHSPWHAAVEKIKMADEKKARLSGKSPSSSSFTSPKNAAPLEDDDVEQDRFETPSGRRKPLKFESEAVPLPSPRQDKHDFYKKLEEDLFESMRKAAKRAIQESNKKPVTKPVTKPVSKKK